MKIAITGHTKGVGKAIADKFDNVLGFSKSTGYDISDDAVVKDIIEKSKDCDVFINNAYHRDAQARLLYKMYQQWQNEPKLIINIGAVSSDNISNFTRLGYIPFWTDYTSYKAQLDFASLQLSDKHKKGMCRVTMLKGGFVDTSTTAGFKALPGVADAMMQPSRFADMAEFVINMDKDVQIRTLSFDEGNISA